MSAQISVAPGPDCVARPCFLLGEIVKIGRLNFYTLGTRRRTTEYTLRGFADIRKNAARMCARIKHGRKQEAARLLGWGRNTLTRKLKELYK